MARGVKRPAQSESAASRLSHVGPLIIAAYLLAAPAPLPVPTLHGRFVPLAIWPSALGAALGFAGLAFCPLGALDHRRQLEQRRSAQARS